MKNVLRCALGLPLMLAFVPAYANCCDRQPAQVRSKQAIRQLESAWSKAYWTGDSAFLECLYAPGFQSADSKGKLDNRTDDIAGSKKNIGKVWTSKRHEYHSDIFMTPHTAIATSFKGDETHGFRVTDIYEYDGQRWHAIFSQDTKY